MDKTPQTVNVGIIGLGTVGGGTVQVIDEHRAEYLDAYGIDLRVKCGCSLEPEVAAELGLTGDAFTSDWRDITGDPDIDIVVELIGGAHPATEIYLDAFAHGKHVVTANKALLGKEMAALAGAAREAGVQLRCEASCGGGIPIIDTLERGLAANDIRTIAGIVNGTTNYILSRMDAEDLDFAEVLADAQRLGYAEADPTADVDGLDAAAKLAILSSISFKSRVTSDDVYTQGIRNVSAADIAWARKAGKCIKLLAVGRKTNAGIEARVHPVMIPANHMLAGVNMAMNAIFAVGDAVGETMFYGAGAGSLPTASAVVADILALAEPLAHGRAVVAEAEPYAREFPVVPMDELETCFYVRVALTEDTEGAKVAIAEECGERGVTLASVDLVGQEVMFTTERVTECTMSAALETLEGLACVEGVASVIRIEDTALWREGMKAN